MPELPEVEVIKKGLNRSVKGKIITNFTCDTKYLLNYPLAEYRRKLKNLKINNITRRAKMLIFELSHGLYILIHLKMTGQLFYWGKDRKHRNHDLPNKFTHATFTFKDGSRLYYNDIRKFGWLRLYDKYGLDKSLKEMKLGVEPFSPNFTLEIFKTLLKSRPNKKIKQFLMDRTFVAGIGNIYSDEVCFYAKVKPATRNKDLRVNEIKLIYTGIKKILRDAIKVSGTTFNKFRLVHGEDGAYYSRLKVYGRYDKPCSICQSKIRRIVLGGRTSSYCPKCQP